MFSSIPRSTAIALALATLGCRGESAVPHDGTGVLVISLQPATWFEDGWSVAEFSADGRLILFGARFGQQLYDWNGRDLSWRYLADLREVTSGTFAVNEFARLASLGGEPTWLMGEGENLVLTGIPGDGVPRFSPDGRRAAMYRGSGGSGEGIFIATPPDGHVLYPVEGVVTGVGWAPDGSTVYATALRDSGLSDLVRLDLETGEVDTLASDLDTPQRYNSVAVSPDGGSVFLSLTAPEPPEPEARHDPYADRDLDIYSLELVTGIWRLVVGDEGDDLYPVVADRALYWTHNDLRDDIVVIPAEGGRPRVVVADAQIPYWNDDGSRIGFTYGGWRVADWALNLDAGVVEVNGDAQAVGAPEPLIVGYHEDFTPAWSPDGRWMAYHSHRSPTPVAGYASPGSTDDVYLMRADGSSAEEIRLTDFGWEVGMSDWAPDSRRLVFDSWERGGEPGVSKPWIATIDPETGALVDLDRLPLPEGLKGTLLAAWSPVGDEIAVVERGEGNSQALWLLAADGTTAERLFQFEASTYGGVDWTPDGASLVYGALSEGRMHLYRVPAGGGEPVQLTFGDVDYIQPQVSPDGRWIAATRMRHTKEVRRLIFQ